MIRFLIIKKYSKFYKNYFKTIVILIIEFISLIKNIAISIELSLIVRFEKFMNYFNNNKQLRIYSFVKLKIEILIKMTCFFMSNKKLNKIIVLLVQ